MALEPLFRAARLISSAARNTPAVGIVNRQSWHECLREISPLLVGRVHSKNADSFRRVSGADGD